MLTFAKIQGVLLGILMILIVLSDTKTLRIRNRILFPAMGWGLISQGIAFGWEGVRGASLGIIIPILTLWCFYRLRFLGAGDIKAFSAIGALMGVSFICKTMLYTFLAGGIIAIILMMVRRNGRERLSRLYHYLKYSMITGKLSPYQDFSEKHQGQFPFAWAMVVGTFIAYIMKDKVNGGLLWLTSRF